MNQIQIPFGMRDIILEDCTKKRALRNRIEKVFDRYGYQEIITPSIEFYQTYQNAFGTINEQDMYKFFDQDGQILSLRMDMTVPIARVCASKFNKVAPPYRFRYCSNVYKVRQMFGGHMSEVSDCGVELIGLDCFHDIEVILCALDTMETLGVSDYTLEIGNSDYFKIACRDIGLSEAQQVDLAQLIDNKSLVDLKAYLDQLGLNDKQKSFFQSLPILGGDVSILDQALEVSFNEDLRKVVLDLKDLYQKCEALGVGEHIQFDLGKVPHLDYYTGIIFEGFVKDVGHSVLSGGRYDKLLKKFGRDLPACGFSVKLDYLLDVVKAPKKEVVTIYYPEAKQMEALKLAQTLRKEKNVVMKVWTKEDVEVVA